MTWLGNRKGLGRGGKGGKQTSHIRGRGARDGVGTETSNIRRERGRATKERERESDQREREGERPKREREGRSREVGGQGGRLEVVQAIDGRGGGGGSGKG